MTAFVFVDCQASTSRHSARVINSSILVRRFFHVVLGALCTVINYGFCPLTRVELQRDCAPWLNEIHSLSYVLSAAAELFVYVTLRLMALKIELRLSLLSGHHKMKRPF